MKKEPGSLIARINRAIAYKRLAKIPEMNKDLEAKEEREPDEAIRAGVAALRKNKKEMTRMLRLALDRGLLSSEQIELFPVFEDYRNDEAFNRLIADYKKKSGK